MSLTDDDLNAIVNSLMLRLMNDPAFRQWLIDLIREATSR
jgi:hypothetical protein